MPFSSGGTQALQLLSRSASASISGTASLTNETGAVEHTPVFWFEAISTIPPGCHRYPLVAGGVFPSKY